MKCANCQSQLLDNARFCHSCGEKVETRPVSCPSCNTPNTRSARFCMQCGCALSASHDFSKGEYKPEFTLDFSNTGKLADQIGAHFFAQLKKRLTDEHDPAQYSDYVSAFYDSGFDKRFTVRANQLAEDAYTIHCQQTDSTPGEVDNLLRRHFEELLDHFIIMHCGHLNEFQLPQAILKYGSAHRNTVDLNAMIFDYLAIQEETKEKFYLDFVKIPEQKLRNVAKSYLFADKKEIVYLICDQTVFGSAKEGFAITDRGVYWKAHFNKAHRVYFDNIRTVKRENEWISVNNRYFHVNPRFNLKMMKLLKKLMRMF